MTDVKFTNPEWIKIRDFLLQDSNAYVGNEANCRRFVEALKGMSRSGAQWRLLPNEYGKWNSVFKRFQRWCEKGVWERMLDHFTDDSDADAAAWRAVGEGAAPVFLSYSQGDRPFAVGLYAELHAAGVVLWRDVYDIPAGAADWWGEIRAAIDGCSSVLLCLSLAALQSPVLSDEWNYARRQGKRVIPVIADEVFQHPDVMAGRTHRRSGAHPIERQRRSLPQA